MQAGQRYELALDCCASVMAFYLGMCEGQVAPSTASAGPQFAPELGQLRVTACLPGRSDRVEGGNTVTALPPLRAFPALKSLPAHPIQIVGERCSHTEQGCRALSPTTVIFALPSR